MSTIVITSKTNVKYTLEFDRSTVEIAERSLGISINDITSGKITFFPLLFRAAFMKHHPNIKTNVVEDLYDQIGNKQELFTTLATMYGECINSLIAEPDEGNAISWETF